MARPAKPADPVPPGAEGFANPFAAFQFEQQLPPHPSRSWAVRGARHVQALVEWFGVRRVLSAVAVAAATTVGAWWLLRAPAPNVEQGLPYASSGVQAGSVVPTSAPSTIDTGGTSPPSSEPAVLVVHVAGAVARPGLVRVAQGARVADAVAAAGGPVVDADLDAVNLAAFVVDAGRVYVPHEGESVAGAVTGASAADGTPALRLDLNTATAADLDRLPGIGPSTASKIVAFRSANGPFRTIDALLKVPGIGPTKLEQFRALVRV